uniref:IgG receptor FcRn large subunit p51 n=1 Tax=Sarcophilus harrisii TaxID=9305 RepID=G3VQS7_SARHA
GQAEPPAPSPPPAAPRCPSGGQGWHPTGEAGPLTLGTQLSLRARSPTPYGTLGGQGNFSLDGQFSPVSAHSERGSGPGAIPGTEAGRGWGARADGAAGQRKRERPELQPGWAGCGGSRTREGKCATSVTRVLGQRERGGPDRAARAGADFGAPRGGGESGCPSRRDRTVSRWEVPLLSPRISPSWCCWCSRCPGVLSAGTPSLFYQLTAVSSAPRGTPKVWGSGWLGPQLFLTYSSGGNAEPWGAWRWEPQEAWFWEEETWYLKKQERLLQEALRVSKEGAQIFQGLMGCQLKPDNSSQPTARFALDGADLLTFDPTRRDWFGHSVEASNVRNNWLNESQLAEKVAEFLLITCPQRLKSHLQRGKHNFQWKEAPEVRAGSHVGPGAVWSTLSCQAFFFFPPELELKFFREGKPVAELSPGLEPWPNGDGTFHSRGTLQVPSGDEALYSCTVQHPALTESITVNFETPGRLPLPVRVSLVAGSVLFLACLAAVVACMIYRKRGGRPALWIFRRRRAGDDVGALLSAPGSAQDSSS